MPAPTTGVDGPPLINNSSEAVQTRVLIAGCAIRLTALLDKRQCVIRSGAVALDDAGQAEVVVGFDLDPVPLQT